MVTGQRTPQPRSNHALRSPATSRSHAAQPHHRLADVPVLERGRVRERLAPGAPGLACRGRLRPGLHRGLRGHAGGAHLTPGPGDLEGRARSRAGSDRALHRRAGRRRGNAARARRPESFHATALEGQPRPRARGGRRLPSHLRAEPDPVPSRGPGARGARQQGHRAHRQGLWRRGRARVPRRLSGPRAARRARVPAPRIPLAALEPPHGCLRRPVREPHPHPAGGHALRAGALAGPLAAVRAHLGHRLGGRRLGRRSVGRAVAVPRAGGRGPDRLLLGRACARREGPRGAGLPDGVRRAHPAGGCRQDGSGGDDPRRRPGRAHRALGPGRRGPPRPPAPARPILAAEGCPAPGRTSSLARAVRAGARLIGGSFRFFSRVHRRARRAHSPPSKEDVMSLRNYAARILAAGALAATGAFAQTGGGATGTSTTGSTDATGSSSGTQGTTSEETRAGSAGTVSGSTTGQSGTGATGSTTVGTGTSTDTNTGVMSGNTTTGSATEQSPTTGTSTDNAATTGSSTSTTPNSGNIGSSTSAPSAGSSLDPGIDNPPSTAPSTNSSDSKPNDPNNPRKPAPPT